MRYELVIILPVHNESRFLKEAVKKVVYYTSKLSQKYLVIIAEDGSTDGSNKIAFEIEKSVENVKVIHNNSKLGRGRAVRNAMLSVEADLYAYVDVDLAAEMKFFQDLVDSIRMGYDIATGSRYVKGSFVRRPPLRLAISKIYNWIVRNLFKTEIQDHQCGFKAFSLRFRNEVLNECICNDWFWDAEVLILGRRMGYRIREFPVHWIERRSNKTSLTRLINDCKVHIVELLKVPRKHKIRGGNFVAVRTCLPGKRSL